jgi:solute carrier family 50 protein (sugar transporter)
MFAAPVPSLRKALSIGSFGDLNPLPWAFMTGNTCGWVAYAFLTKDIFVLIGNAPSFLLSLWLNVGACQLQYLEGMKNRDKVLRNLSLQSLFSEEEPPGLLEQLLTITDEHHQQKTRNSYLLPVAGVKDDISNAAPSSRRIHHTTIFLSVTATWLFLLSIAAFLPAEYHHAQVLTVGIAANINLVFFLAAPLSSILVVVRHQNSSSIHGPTMMASIANCSLWSTYGLLAIHDPFIYLPNIIGLVISIVQLLLFLCYRSTSELDTMAEQEELEESDYDRVLLL